MVKRIGISIQHGPLFTKMQCTSPAHLWGCSLRPSKTNDIVFFWLILPISMKVTLLAFEQLYECWEMIETIKISLCNYRYIFHQVNAATEGGWCNQNQIKHSKAVCSFMCHGDVIKWKHFPRCWPYVRGIHRSPVDSPHKGQWRGTLMFSLICPWTNCWSNNQDAGDLRRYRAHYDVTVMLYIK